MKHVLTKSLVVSWLLFLALFISVSSTVRAITTSNDKSCLQLDTCYYDPNPTANCSAEPAPVAPPAPVTSPGAPTYVAVGSIPATGLTVGTTTYGGSFSGGSFGPSNNLQGGKTPYDDNGMGYDGKPLPGRTAWAELGNGSGIGKALGGLPKGTKIEITYNGKSVIAEKDDIGKGGGPIGGHPRAVDLWWETARLLDFKSGSGVTTIHAVDPSTPITPVTGQARSVGAATPPPAAGGQTSNGGKIYVLGDSLTVGMNSADLKGKLEAGGKWKVLKINGVGGKPVKWGLDQVKADKAIIATADAILVGLGTNNVGDVAGSTGSAAGATKVKDQMQQLIDAAKAANPKIKIYWTDLYGTGTLKTIYGIFSLDQAYGILNPVIKDLSGANHMSVLPWSTSDVAKRFVRFGDVHPSGHYPEMVDFIVNALNNAAPGGTAVLPPPTASCCTSLVPGVALSGNDNKTKIWNYLVGKGLTPIQAAGAMGNISVESAHTWDPTIVEGGWGFPSHSNTIPPSVGPAGQPGYGLIQWTSPGRKQGLGKFAAAHNPPLPVNDLLLQLDYMWSELSGPYKARALDPLLKATDLAKAVSIWQDKYEVGKGFAPRLAAAITILAQFGSGAPAGPVAGTPPPASTAPADCAAAASNPGEYKNPFTDVKNIKQAGIDAGVDYSGDGPVHPIGNATLISIDGHSGWVGGNFVSYKLSDGPAAGKTIYVSENCTVNTALKKGDTINTGTTLCTMHNVYPYIETGWATPSSAGSGASPLAYVDKCYYITNSALKKSSTAYGVNFDQLMRKLGVPKASQLGGAVTCTLPSGFPTW